VQVRRLTDELQKVSDEKDDYAQRCHDLDLQVCYFWHHLQGGLRPAAVLSGGGKGGKGGASAPGGTVQGVAFGGVRIWNSEIWPLLATQTRAESVSSSFLFGSCN